MKRSIFVFMFMVVFTALAFSDALRGTIAEQGSYSVFLEHGSQTIATNYDMNVPKKYQVNGFTEVGFTYGVSDRLALGLSIQPLYVINYPVLRESKLYWTFEGTVPAAFLGEYYLGKAGGFDLKARLKYGLAKRNLVYEKEAFPDSYRDLFGIDEDQNLTIHDSSLGIWGETKLTDKLNFGFGAEYVVNRYKASEHLSKVLIDLDRRFVRLILGADYMFTEDLCFYIYAVHAFDSAAVGQHDDDIVTWVTVPPGIKVPGPENLLKRDDYGVLSAGFKWNI